MVILVDKVAGNQRVSRSFTRAVLPENFNRFRNASHDEKTRPHRCYRSSRNVFCYQSGVSRFDESPSPGKPMRRMPTWTCPLVKSRSMASAAPAEFSVYFKEELNRSKA